MIRPTPVHRPVWEPVYRDVQGPVWRNGAGGGVAYYIDPSYSGGSSDGSYSAPWTDFTAANSAFTGDMGGRILRLKSGQTIYDELSFSAASNFTIETYGGSTKAIIDGSQIASWTWTNLSGDIWYANSGTESAIWVGDVAYERACVQQTTPDQATMDRSVGMFWFGNHSSNPIGNRLYVHVPPGMNMETERLAGRVRSQKENFALRLNGCSAVAIRAIQVQRGQWSVMSVENHGAGLIIDDVVSRWCGKFSFGQNLLDVTGVSEGAPATDISITKCQFSENRGGDNNNATEFSWVTGLTISECDYRRILSQAVEFWKTVKNARITRCRFEEIGGSTWWLNGDTDYGAPVVPQDHDNNQMDNCIATSIGSMNRETVLTDQGSSLLRYEGGTNTRLYNNTYIGQTRVPILLKAGTHASNKNTISLKNNVFYVHMAYSNAWHIQTTDTPATPWTFPTAFTGAINEVVSDNNHFFSLRNTNQASNRVGYIWAGAVDLIGLANWQSYTGNPDAHSHDGNPLLSAALGTVTATTTTSGTAASGVWDIPLTSVTGMAVNGIISIATVSAPIVHVSRIVAVNTSTKVVTTETRVPPAGIASGAAVTYYAELQTDATPQAGSPLLNAGVGSATDPLIPTTDFYGNPRSTTTPDIGAVEV